MPKYYVYSGELKEIVDAPDYKEALRKIFLNQKDNSIMLSSCIFVSEKGFTFDRDSGGTEKDIDRHRQNACKMVEFYDDFVLPEHSDLLIDINLIFDILGKG